MMTMQEAKSQPINYYQGIFDKYKNEPNFEHWEHFPETMWRLGYEMDCGESFEDFLKNSELKLSEVHSERQEKRNNLYVLEHSDRQIVGNYLFSYWRYLTHWAMGRSEFDIDYLKRIIAILERAYEQEDTSEHQKRIDLYLRQKKTLELFLERNAISKEQFDKSLGDLTEKMGMQEYRSKDELEEL